MKHVTSVYDTTENEHLSLNNDTTRRVLEKEENIWKTEYLCSCLEQHESIWKTEFLLIYLFEKRLQGKTEQVLNMLQGQTEKECYKVAQGKTEQALQGETGNWQTNTDRLWNTGKW